MDIQTSLVVLAKLHKLLSTVRQAHSMVMARDELAGILREIGSNEYKAALCALSDSKLSNQPDREMSLAIGHLVSAQEAFAQVCKRADKTVNWTLYQHAWRDSNTCFGLIACTYYGLGEDRLKTKYAEHLSSDFQAFYDFMYDLHDDEVQPPNAYFRKRLNEEELKVLELVKSLGLQGWTPKQKPYNKKWKGWWDL
jgi:hypothetical protein